VTEITGGPGTSAFIPPGEPFRDPDEVLAIGERFGLVILPVVPEPRGLALGVSIELRLLRYFAVVAEELHVGNAAARLYISPPALSQQVRALADQVRLPLFVRHARGMELTDAGEVLLHEARELLSGSERLEATVEEELRRGRVTGLRIGLPPGLSPHAAPGAAGAAAPSASRTRGSR
jgi:hypothetical protein